MTSLSFDDQRPPTTFARITSLLQRGQVVRYDNGKSGGAFYLYVAALNDAEREEAVLDGATARATSMLANTSDSPHSRVIREELRTAPREDIIVRILAARAPEAWALGQDDLHADDEWRGDKLLLIERADELMSQGMKVDAEEMAALGALNEAYLAAWRAKSMARSEAMKSEYDSMDRETLVETFLKIWAETRSMRAQMAEYRITQLYYGTRICYAPVVEGDVPPDHSRCGGHRERLFPDRETVRSAPDELSALLIPAATELDNQGQAALGK